ncbi:MAG: hypothetical protein GX672_07035 [Synergistaceae bacterium]|nr:hypothetical protein [Synergistaceae bacterium]
MNNGSVNKKRLVIRLILLSLIVVVCFLLFYFGKEHELLFDNKTVEINGQSYEALEFVRITINGDAKKSIERYSKERDVVKVSGPKHTIKVEIVDEDSDKVIKSEERVFNFGKTSSLMISVPAVAEKAPDVYLPLPGSMTQPPAPEPAPEKETETTGAMEIAPPVLSD